MAKMVEDNQGISKNHFQSMHNGLSKEEIFQIEMHGFTDSSVKAYYAVIYVVITQHSGVYAKQLTAKSRVAKPKMTAKARADWSTTSNEDDGECQISAHTRNCSYVWMARQSSGTLLVANKGEYKQLVRTRIDQYLERISHGNIVLPNTI